ncbi:protein PLASTID MOVEMENT IMPAIRED 15-like [Zingiber officinale]|uniref:Protein PLASTID MOVEMENT IMPAIRED 2 n=1 Tax=Zingiber officinale TaxID=94328 RepID=A0A8J5G1Z1_ZINOF|nr:protein PLASTID MOVEMENT IMPAIRED 15-like [Zingiber officinale]KAG6496454.1 hypothetical protein ZIOFF_044321 [Zingiber officinale]
MEINHRKKAVENYTNQQINKLKFEMEKRDAESEIDQLLSQLHLTVSDIHALQKEIKQSSCSIKRSVEKAPSVQAAEAEVEKAKNELLSLKEEGFKLMDVMDAIREEIQQIYKEKERSSVIKQRLESTLEHLKYELHSSKSKLEVASVAEKRASDLVLDLSAALRQLQADRDAARRDAELTHEAIKALRREVKKTESSVLHMEDGLQAAIEEMEEAIAFEAVAEQTLRAITERTSSDRANAMSKFEYHLIKQAKAAQEIAGRKVAEAQSWIEALANGKDREKKTRRRSLSTGSNKVHVPKKVVKTKLSAHEGDTKRRSLDLKLAPAVKRRSLTVSRVPEQSRRAKSRRSGSSSRGQPSVVSSDTCLAASRKTIVLKLIRFLGGSGN